MIDTLALRWRVEAGSVGDAEVRALESVAVGAVVTSGVVGAASGSQSSWCADVRGLGRVKLTYGGDVYWARSLSKARQEFDGVDGRWQDNGVLLSASGAARTFADVVCRVGDVLPFVDPGSVEVRRADVVYDRHVPGGCMGVLKGLLGAVKPTRGGAVWFDNRQGGASGLMLRGRAVVHRVYDKGLECGSSLYRDVLRSEEQLRAGAVGLGRVVDGIGFDRQACVDVLNERYLDYQGGGAVLDVGDLVAAGAWAQVALTLNPELLPGYRERVGRSAYYEMVKKVRRRRAEAVPVDLRVPDEAWLGEELAA